MAVSIEDLNGCSSISGHRINEDKWIKGGEDKEDVEVDAGAVGRKLDSALEAEGEGDGEGDGGGESDHARRAEGHPGSVHRESSLSQERENGEGSGRRVAGDVG
ncbi:hypothetical protein K440DRAFT_642720 [Wilcoxina mikolae CBS 423.85]|nr:hypothetical protein K440DRAFT_642720 [Wilcoxina mikolae CBS 423.85]